jgi:hypothetical protein
VSSRTARATQRNPVSKNQKKKKKKKKSSLYAIVRELVGNKRRGHKQSVYPTKERRKLLE